jgi:hypothetical protein
MTKAVYDTNDDGVVDAAASVPWSGVTSPPDINSGVLIQGKAKVTLAKGQPVYITPGTAAVPDVDLCDNTNVTKSRIYGIAAAAITAGNTGYIQRVGMLTNVDTRTSNTTLNPNAETWVEGDLLFATTGGGLTKTRPTSGRSVKVGYSVKGSSATDSIVMHPMENPVWITGASGENVVLRLGDNAGTNKVSIRDYANNEVAYINSDGLISGSIDIHGTTAETSIADNDEVLIYDTSASANRRMTKANLVSGLSGTVSEYITRSLEGVVYETTLMYWRAPAACTINSCAMSLSSNPSATGSYCKVQVMKNGLLETNSIFTSDTPMQVTENTSASNGIYTGSGTLDSGQTSVASGDIIWFRVNQADTGSADLLVQMKVTYT